MNQYYGYVYDLGICIAPILAFAYQYFHISKNNYIGSFSIDLCGIVIFSNIFRVGFYLFEGYSLALLFQSLFMIFIQIMIIKICVKIKKEEILANQQDQKQPKKIYCYQFWRWDSLSQYILVIVITHVVVLGLCYLLNQLNLIIAGVIIGYIGLMSQSVYFFPQILRNHKQKQVKGVSYMLIFLAFIGQILQLLYYVLYVKVSQFQEQPIPFIISSIVQILLDILIVAQIIYFKYIFCEVNNKTTQSQIKEQQFLTIEKIQQQINQNSTQINLQQNQRERVDFQQSYNSIILQ